MCLSTHQCPTLPQARVALMTWRCWSRKRSSWLQKLSRTNPNLKTRSSLSGPTHSSSRFISFPHRATRKLPHKLRPACFKSKLCLILYRVCVLLWCRSDTSRSELAELAKQANPDEIDIDDDDDDDEGDGDGEPDGENSCTLTQSVLVSGCRFCSIDGLSLSYLLSRGAARAEKRPYGCVWRTEGRLKGLSPMFMWLMTPESCNRQK